MENYLIWLILGLVLLGVEMMIGSIYLLALVGGCAIACVFAFMGTSFTTQCIVAAIVAIAGVIAAFVFRRNIRKKLTPNQDCDNLDKGQIINVEKIDSDGGATVNYRGAQWKAYASEGPLETGIYHIEKVDGTRLILTK
ncbi:NfeD family protein [Succinivibrio dextrinosolvens]|uniref:NfeD family protein n=1 Tax=Succinivibrio dextrinosolvens TaxID=83771 RepID=UPI00247A2AC6|nr:NfeD family protein [Succinivibrio dextrinosolvens]